MAYDYAPKVAMATKMIAKYGRAVVFSKVATDTATDDPLGPPVSAPETQSPVIGAFVYPNGLAELGIKTTKSGLFKNSEQIGLFAPAAFDYAAQTFMTEMDGKVWKVDAVDMLKPGDTAVLYFVGLVTP